MTIFIGLVLIKILLLKARGEIGSHRSALRSHRFEKVGLMTLWEEKPGKMHRLFQDRSADPSSEFWEVMEFESKHRKPLCKITVVIDFLQADQLESLHASSLFKYLFDLRIFSHS